MGLAVLLWIGTALILPIARAAVSAIGGEPMNGAPGWMAFLVAVFIVGLYASTCSVYGLYLKVVSSHHGRKGPAPAARRETAAVVVAWLVVAAWLASLIPGSAVLVGLVAAALASGAARCIDDDLTPLALKPRASDCTPRAGQARASPAHADELAQLASNLARELHTPCLSSHSLSAASVTDWALMLRSPVS